MQAHHTSHSHSTEIDVMFMGKSVSGTNHLPRALKRDLNSCRLRDARLKLQRGCDYITHVKKKHAGRIS
jgi:hypothetical protein